MIRVLVAASILLASTPAAAQMNIVSGSYAGTGVAQSITGLGFQPTVVIVKGDTARPAVAANSSMPVDRTKPLNGSTGLLAGLITSLDVTGFSVGIDDRVNGALVTYYWTALSAAALELSDFSYVGNGLASQAITGVGFQPELVVVMSAGADQAVFRSASMVDSGFVFGAAAGAAGRILSFDVDGFTVGDTANVNLLGRSYHFFAVNAVAGRFAESSYVGDGLDNRNIAGVGFEPEWLFLKGANTQAPPHKSGATGRAVDISTRFTATANGSNLIQALQSNGFQVGAITAVNGLGTTYYYMAFGRSIPTEARVRSLSALAFDQGTRVRWQTDVEWDNLGFHVHREKGGHRLRLTPSLVAGSALASAQTAPGDGRSYEWWDPSPPNGARYFIEDVDLAGRRSWHGPVRTEAPEEERAAAALPRPVFLPDLGRSDAAVPVAERPSGLHRSLGGRVGETWTLPGQPAVKLMIRTDGWTRVGWEELFAAGLDRQAEPSTLRLFADGIEQSMVVTDDGVELHGVGVDTPSTGERVYWLVAGTEPGARVPLAEEGPSDAPIASGFPIVVERRDRTIYFGALVNGDRENFFGALVTTAPVDQVLPIHHLDTTSDAGATLEVSIQGVTAMAEDPSDHRVHVAFNGVEVGVMAFDGRVASLGRYSLPSTELREGDGVVTLWAEGGDDDVSLVDFVRLTHPHRYSADGDRLRATVPAGHRVTIDGFSTGDVRVVDVTDPDGPIELAVTVEPEPERGTFAVSARPGLPGTRTLLAFTGASVLSPASLLPNHPSALRDAPGADLVIVAHSSLVEAVEPLRERREREGLSVMVVDVEDVYDELSYGQKEPRALRDLLAHARAQWQRPPSSLLLLGDASFDPRDFLGLGSFDLVPTHLTPTQFLETASDDWFADPDDDGLADLGVGRLPARTLEQAEALIARIVAYQPDEEADWRRRALLVADHDEAYSFEDFGAHVRSTIPAGFTVEEVLRGVTDDQTARRALLASWEEGVLIVHYTGHGSVQVWADGALLTSADAAALRNGARLPLVVAMTCLGGAFQDLYTTSLAESLLAAPDGGALAVWTSSGLTFPEEQRPMAEEMLRLLFERRSLGAAVRAAKAASDDLDVRRTFVLFGDPSQALLPHELEPTGGQIAVVGATVDPLPEDPLQVSEVGCSCRTQGGRASESAWAVIATLLGACLLRLRASLNRREP